MATSTTSRPSIPGYEILAELGVGATARVYRARQESLGREVVLKVLRPEFTRDPTLLARFEEEARALARLDHPHVVTVHDRGRAGDQAYLVLEHVDGPTLRDVMAEVRDLGAYRRVLELMIQVAGALAYVHSRGLVHRDVKPENVLLDRSRRARLTDFGIATPLPGITAGPDAYRDPVGGTPAYMAPEQLEEARVDDRADVFAFGVMLHECLTGHRPVVKRPPMAGRRPFMSRTLDELMAGCLSMAPEDRPEMARVEAVLRELHAEATELSISSRVSRDFAVLPEVHARTVPWNRLAGQLGATAAGLLLLSLLALSSWASERAPLPRPDRPGALSLPSYTGTRPPRPTLSGRLGRVFTARGGGTTR